MKSESDILVLDVASDSSKFIAKAMSNKNCILVLDFLESNPNSTKSDISKSLGLSLSLLHYTLDLLVKSGLVVADEFHYSEKGREILHYSLSDKPIVFVPKSKQKSILEKLSYVLGFFGILFIFDFVRRCFFYFSGDIVVGESSSDVLPVVTYDSVSKSVGGAMRINVDIKSSDVLAKSDLSFFNSILTYDYLGFWNDYGLFIIGFIIIIVVILYIYFRFFKYSKFYRV